MYFDCGQNVRSSYNHFILKVITWAPLKHPKIWGLWKIYKNSTKIMSKRMHKVISLFFFNKVHILPCHLENGLKTLILNDIFEVQRLINDSINVKFGNCKSICTPFVYCYILGGQIFKTLMWNVYIVLICFFFLSQVNVVIIIKLSPF
jgi:hypothetical protein